MSRQPGRTRSMASGAARRTTPRRASAIVADVVGVARQERLGRERIVHAVGSSSGGVHVTIPTSLGPRPLIVQPSPSLDRQLVERRLEAGLLRAGRVDPELAADEPAQRLARLEPARVDGHPVTVGRAAARLEQLERRRAAPAARPAPRRGRAARTDRRRTAGTRSIRTATHSRPAAASSASRNGPIASMS